MAMLRPAMLSVLLLAIAIAPAFGQTEPRFVKKPVAASKQAGKPGKAAKTKTKTHRPRPLPSRRRRPRRPLRRSLCLSPR